MAAIFFDGFDLLPIDTNSPILLQTMTGSLSAGKKWTSYNNSNGSGQIETNPWYSGNDATPYGTGNSLYFSSAYAIKTFPKAYSALIIGFWFKLSLAGNAWIFHVLNGSSIVAGIQVNGYGTSPTGFSLLGAGGTVIATTKPVPVQKPPLPPTVPVNTWMYLELKIGGGQIVFRKDSVVLLKGGGGGSMNGVQIGNNTFSSIETWYDDFNVLIPSGAPPTDFTGPLRVYTTPPTYEVSTANTPSLGTYNTFAMKIGTQILPVASSTITSFTGNIAETYTPLIKKQGLVGYNPTYGGQGQIFGVAANVVVQSSKLSTITTGSLATVPPAQVSGLVYYGTINTILVVSQGHGYTTPTVSISAPDAQSLGYSPSVGIQATATAVASSGHIVSVNITNPGSGYYQPTAIITDTTPGSTGASISATIIGTNVTFTPAVNTPVVGQNVIISNPIPPPTVSVTGTTTVVTTSTVSSKTTKATNTAAATTATMVTGTTFSPVVNSPGIYQTILTLDPLTGNPWIASDVKRVVTGIRTV